MCIMMYNLYWCSIADADPVVKYMYTGGSNGRHLLYYLITIPFPMTEFL